MLGHLPLVAFWLCSNCTRFVLCVTGCRIHALCLGGPDTVLGGPDTVLGGPGTVSGRS